MSVLFSKQASAGLILIEIRSILRSTQISLMHPPFDTALSYCPTRLRFNKKKKDPVLDAYSTANTITVLAEKPTKEQTQRRLRQLLVQSSKLLLVLVSTVFLGFEPRRDPWPYFRSIQTFTYFEMGRPFRRKDGVWLLLVIPRILGGDSVGSFTHSINESIALTLTWL
jgi:hypothetical protein